jgi:hypothetical protein
MSKAKTDSYLSPCTKISSKWIKDLNIGHQTMKKLQELVGNTLELVSLGKNFLSRIQKAQHLRERMNKWE